MRFIIPNFYVIISLYCSQFYVGPYLAGNFSYAVGLLWQQLSYLESATNGAFELLLQFLIYKVPDYKFR